MPLSQIRFPLISRDRSCAQHKSSGTKIPRVLSSGRQCASFSPDRVREIEQNCWSSFVQSLKIVAPRKKTLAYVPRASFDKIRMKPMVKLFISNGQIFPKLKYNTRWKVGQFFLEKDKYIFEIFYDVSNVHSFRANVGVCEEKRGLRSLH